MTKPAVRPLIAYTKDALQLLGGLIKASRLQKRMPASELAERACISRSLLRRIEAGDPGCSIGAVFEVAALVGVRLFDLDAEQLAIRKLLHKEKLALLPKSARAVAVEIDNNF